MPDHHRDRAVAKRVDEPNRVSRHVEDAKRIRIGVVGIVPADGATVATLVGGDHVVTSGCQRQHHLAPAISELREAMQQQDGWPPRRFVTGLQNMHRHPVYIGDVARADAGWNRAVAVRRQRREIGADDVACDCGAGRRAVRDRKAAEPRRRGRQEAAPREVDGHMHTSALRSAFVIADAGSTSARASWRFRQRRSRCPTGRRAHDRPRTA